LNVWYFDCICLLRWEVVAKSNPRDKRSINLKICADSLVEACRLILLLLLMWIYG
jgi:hypothetical protein